MKEIGKHPNIVEFIEFGKEAERKISKISQETIICSYLAMEYVENNALFQVLRNTKDSELMNYKEKWIRYWFRQMVEGL